MSWLSRSTERLFIGLLVLAMFAGALIIMTFFTIPDQNRDVVIQLVGGVNTLAGLVIGYYFGSTSKNDNPVDTQPVTVTNTKANPVPTKEGDDE